MNCYSCLKYDFINLLNLNDKYSQKKVNKDGYISIRRHWFDTLNINDEKKVNKDDIISSVLNPSVKLKKPTLSHFPRAS